MGFSGGRWVHRCGGRIVLIALALAFVGAAATAEQPGGEAPKAAPVKEAGGQSLKGSLQAVTESPREPVPEPAEEEPDRGAKVYEQLVKSTAWIVANNPNSGAGQSGTGWIIDEDRRLLVTNQHVVYSEKDGGLYADDHFRVYFPAYDDGELVTDQNAYLAGGKSIAAKVIEVDTARDLAVLQLAELPDDVVAIPLAKRSAKPGQTIHSLGNPGSSGALWVYSSGTVRQLYRAKEQFPDALYDYLRVETQSPTNFGDSGGPAVNDRGELLAVNHGALLDARLMTRFIDVSEVRSVMEMVEQILSASTAQELNARGDHYFNGSRYDLAIADYTAANKLDPAYAKPLGNRGWAWMRKGDNVTALADFNEAIQLDPRDTEFRQGRARVYIAQQEYDNALKDCVESIRLEPAQAQNYNQRGDVYFYQEKYGQAITDYSEAIRLNDANAEYYNNRGACLSRLDKHADAISDYSKAIDLNANEPQYLYNRASAFQKTENQVGMALDFVALEEKFPEFAQKQKTHYDRRILKVTNTTNFKLQFWLKYYNKATDSEWKWFPSAPGEGNWSIFWLEPGESTFLQHDGVRVNANRIRFWASNAPTTEEWKKFTREWPGYEEQDYILLSDEGEDGYFMRTYELRLE